MSTEITTDPGGNFSANIAPVVYYNTDVTDDEGWTLVPFLWCLELKLAVNAYSEATLEYEVGHSLLQPGGDAFNDYHPLNLRGLYVKIVVPQDEDTDDIVWVGYILTDILSRDGVKTHAGVNSFEGEKQIFHCVGLEWFLDRRQVESSLVEQDDTFVEIQRALKFNGGESSTIDMKAAHRGNRATISNDDGLYYFTGDPTTDDRWTAGDIVRYLLEYHNPFNSDGDPSPCAYALDPDDDLTGYLEGFHPTLASEHHTIFQLLNKIITPQRGLMWWLEFDLSAATAYIRVASLAREDIILSDD